MPDVELSWDEVRMAGFVGISRAVNDLREGRQERHGHAVDAGSFGDPVLGAMGELAFAKWADIFWKPTAIFQEAEMEPGDVGEFQVRTSALETASLIVRQDDLQRHPSSAFVLVTGFPPRFRICGWILVESAAQDRWIRSPVNRPPAWFVPQSCLRRVEELLATNLGT